MASTTSTLVDRARARLDEAGAAWLAQATTDVGQDPDALATAFARAGRRAGRGPVDPQDPADPAGVVHGTVDDGARAALVVALAAALADDPAGLAARLATLYRQGDTAERRGVLRGLDALVLDGTPLPPDVVALGLELVVDALRTNDTSLVAAAVGPFTAAHLDDHAWRHAVLKLIFMGVPLDAVAGLEDRRDAELARMAGDFAAERRAAGRVVPADVDRLVAPLPAHRTARPTSQES